MAIFNSYLYVYLRVNPFFESLVIMEITNVGPPNGEIQPPKSDTLKGWILTTQSAGPVLCFPVSWMVKASSWKRGS